MDDTTVQYNNGMSDEEILAAAIQERIEGLEFSAKKQTEFLNNMVKDIMAQIRELEGKTQ